MSEPVLNARTQRQLDSYLARPAHGLLLVGKTGVGKSYLARWLTDQLAADAVVIKPEEGKSIISIEQIRQLYTLTRTGRPLVITIEGANTMGSEAQNAFLKLLEEPPENTRFILTSSSEHALLPTIRSRSQLIEVLPPSKDVLKQHASMQSGINEVALSSLIHTSEGLPGALFGHLANSELLSHHQASVAEAKSFYSGTSYDRLKLCVAHNYERSWSEEILRLLGVIIKSLLRRPDLSSSQKGRLLKQSQLIELTAERILYVNGNPKIHLAKLAVQLG